MYSVRNLKNPLNSDIYLIAVVEEVNGIKKIIK